jgi:hypothetical protein
VIIQVGLALAAAAAIAAVLAAVSYQMVFLGIIAGGALGSLIHSLRSFWWYAGNRELRWSWVPMYICSPFVGAALALLVCLLVRGGAIQLKASDDQSGDVSTIMYTIGLAGLIGMFSELAAWKLRETAISLFGKPPRGKDSVSGDEASGHVETVTNEQAKRIIAQCEKDWEANKSDCNSFVKAVAADLQIRDIPAAADADGIVNFLQGSAEWRKLTAGDDAAAKQAADAGKFVIGGLTSAELGDAHGHVVVTVSGPFDPGHGRYPRAYWGQLGGVGNKNTTINFAFRRPFCDRVRYFVKDLPG